MQILTQLNYHTLFRLMDESINDGISVRYLLQCND